mgnify:CR=1 FL=1
MGILSKLFGQSKDNDQQKKKQNRANTGSAASDKNSTNSNNQTNNQTNKMKENNQKPENVNAGQTQTGENTNAKTRIYNLIIVDESGSMNHLTQSTLSGINETINTIKSAQEQFADTQIHTLTLVTFDGGTHKEDVRIIIDNKPVAEVCEFDDYHPWGNTPLYDAMGMSLTRIQSFIKKDEDATGVVTVLTDGLENASREWSAKQLGDLINRLKEEGWTFSYMGSAHNVKSVTDLLNIDNVVEFSHNDLGATSTWARENTSRMSFFGKLDRFSREMPNASINEKMERKRAYAKSYYSGRVTPDYITELEPDEIFVFGSNAMGQHAGGAARQAVESFGAIMGQGEGLQGQSYAIPTMEGLDNLRTAVMRFIEFADQHPEMKFLVTRIGCGIAGYRVSDIAPLFSRCIKLSNVALPVDFWEELGLKM